MFLDGSDLFTAIFDLEFGQIRAESISAQPPSVSGAYLLLIHRLTFFVFLNVIIPCDWFPSRFVISHLLIRLRVSLSSKNCVFKFRKW